MKFPLFNPKIPLTSYKSHELQNLSTACEAFWNSRGANGVTIKKTNKGFVFGIDARFRQRGRILPVVLWETPEMGSKVLTLRQVKYDKEPPDGPDGPYKYEGEPFTAYPDFGKSASDYMEFGPPNGDPVLPRPNSTCTFLNAQREGFAWRVWFPSATAKEEWCVVRDVGNGFQTIITVEKISTAGDVVTLTGNTISVRIWPPGHMSMQFAPLVWPANTWMPKCNVGRLFSFGGETKCHHLSFFRFNTVDFDPGFYSGDCSPVIGVMP